MINYRSNQAHTLQAAYSGQVRIGYIDRSNDQRWLFSLNTIQPQGGRIHGIKATEQEAKDALWEAWVEWVKAAGLEFIE